MNNKDALKKVFTGREIQGIILKGELEENGIATVIKNDYEAGMSARHPKLMFISAKQI